KHSQPHPAQHAKHDTHDDSIDSRTTYQPGQGSVSLGYHAFNKFPSDNIPSDAFGIPTQFDTRWPAALVHSLRESSLEITIRNPDPVNAMALCDPSVWFPRIEVLS